MNLLKSKICLSIITLVFFAGTVLAQDQQITDYSEVQTWMDNYEQAQDQEIRGHIYGSDALIQLMAQPGVTQVKIYNAFDESGQRKLVFKGVGIDQSEVGLAFDISKSCPPFCGGGGVAVESIGAPIDLSEAQLMVTNFSLTFPNEVISYTFDATTVNTVIAENQAAGLFLAYGTDHSNQHQMILMGLTSEGNLIEGVVGINAELSYSNTLTSMK